MTAPNPLRTSRTLGALLGVHSGDSLGATLEFRQWSYIKQQYPHGLRDIIGGGHFSWHAGQATDDTDLTRAVLLAYLSCAEARTTDTATSGRGTSVARAAAEHALRSYEGEWPGRSLGERPIDVGGARSAGLQRYKSVRDPARAGAGPGSAGNGSLMRCIPTGLFAGADRRRSEAMVISEFTHNDVRCTVACAAYSEIVAAPDLDCVQVAEAIAEGETLPLARVASEGPRGEIRVDVSGYVLSSLKLAVAAVLDPRSLEDVLVDVVRLGGDSDTHGAIAGGLLGARDGVESIPERWLEKLQFREEFEHVAKRILQLQQDSGSCG
ncbi:ADP-ribosylglycohydrolase family protein [Lizonia empirigonia]|nr:ADP-ribosylglycohydrolase family protein [Lizonia empirigonia]